MSDLPYSWRTPCQLAIVGISWGFVSLDHGPVIARLSHRGHLIHLFPISAHPVEEEGEGGEGLFSKEDRM